MVIYRNSCGAIYLLAQMRYSRLTPSAICASRVICALRHVKEEWNGRADPSPTNGFVYCAAVICGRADPSPTNGFVYCAAELYGRADPSPTNGFVYRAAVICGRTMPSHTIDVSDFYSLFFVLSSLFFINSFRGRADPSPTESASFIVRR